MCRLLRNDLNDLISFPLLTRQCSYKPPFEFLETGGRRNVGNPYLDNEPWFQDRLIAHGRIWGVKEFRQVQCEVNVEIQSLESGSFHHVQMILWSLMMMMMMVRMIIIMVMMTMRKLFDYLDVVDENHQRVWI